VHFVLLVHGYIITDVIGIWTIFMESFICLEKIYEYEKAANYCSVSLAPLFSGVAGLSASSSSKADILNT